MTPIIESNEYREEEKALAKDERIRAMAQEVLGNPDLAAKIREGEWDAKLMLAASRTYALRCTYDEVTPFYCQSIGGPIRAVRVVLRECPSCWGSGVEHYDEGLGERCSLCKGQG